MPSKQKLLSDIELQLHQGAPSDDSELDHTQIAYWVDLELPSLMRQECDTMLRQGKQIPPIYIVRENGLELTEEVTNVDDAKERFYFDLTGEVIDLYDDAGVVRVLAISDEDDRGYEVVSKVSNESLDMFENLRFAKPSQENLVWYRMGNRVFLQGLATADVDFNTFIVDYVAKQDVMALADSDDVRVSDLILPMLIDKVVQRGKLQMYGTTPDETSDGKDTKQVMYHTAIQNPTRKEQPTE